MLFLAQIDLHEAGHLSARLVECLGQRLDQARSIKRVDAIKQRHGIIGLFRLQLADKVQLDIGRCFAQGRPFLLCFLHAVFTKDALTCCNKRGYGLHRMHFTDRNQRYVFAFAAGDPAGLGYFCFDTSKTASRTVAVGTLIHLSAIAG